MLWSYYRTNVTENVFDSTKGQTHTHKKKKNTFFCRKEGCFGLVNDELFDIVISLIRFSITPTCNTVPYFVLA